MKQRQRVLASVAILAIMVGGASVWLSWPKPAVIPSVQDLLAVPLSASQLQLLGARRGADGKPVSEFANEEDYYDVPGLRDLIAKRRTRADGSVVIDYFRPGGGFDPKKLLTLIYGPKALGERPHLLQKTSFTEDGATVASEGTYDPLSGMRMTTSLRDDKGNYVNRTYFDDGVTVQTEDFVAADGGSDRVLSHKRFYANGELHVISTKDPNGVSRTVLEYGIRRVLLTKTVTGTTSRQADGETVTHYYPNPPYAVSMTSKTDTSGTHVRYLRPDGRLMSTWEMTRDQLTITVYDDDGKNVVRVLVYDQASVNTKNVDNIDVDEIKWTPREVHGKNPDGKDAWTLFYKGGKLVAVDRFNVTVDGVTYARAHSEYRASDSIWLSTSYYSQEMSVYSGPSRVVTVGGDGGASHYADMVTDMSTNDLPMPPPQYQYGPYGMFGYFHDH